MSLKNNLVFVYGTLLSSGCNPASRMADADVLGPATAPGRIYDLGWFPGFRPCEDPEDEAEVVGELIAVTQEGLERLDAYEGCPHLYRRENILVKLEDGTLKPSFIYVYNDVPHPDDIIPDGDFLSYISSEKEAG